jgi:hypothetical protein
MGLGRTLRLTFAAAVLGLAIAGAPAAAFETECNGWSLHGQTTFLPQGYPGFRSPYEGANSLTGASQVRETWTSTAFIGRGLWEGAEVFVNPELDQGFGLFKTWMAVLRGYLMVAAGRILVRIIQLAVAQG